MAGLSGRQVVVDVVAAAERLRPGAGSSGENASTLEPERGVPMEVEARCSFGHLNAPGCRFCGRCGLPVGLPVPVRGPAERPRPAAMLTPEERAAREREHAEAVAAAARFEQAPARYVPSDGEAILIHFIADGLTAFGQVWYRGQELQIGPDHPRWAEALGWITLDRFGQVERWGEQKFDFGPWPGRRSYAHAAGTFEQITVTGPDGSRSRYAGPTEAELLAADDAERRRGRAVPAPVFG
jgi:hypothetical protein